MDTLDPVNTKAVRIAAAAIAMLGAASVTAASVISASSARAATPTTPAISATRSCYVNANPSKGAPVTVTGTGFTPGDSIAVDGGSVSSMTMADGTGSFTAVITGPVLATTGPAARQFTLTASNTAGTTTATTRIRVANLAFGTKPAVAKPSRVVTFHFSGFVPDHAVYAHFVHGKQLATTHKYGRATGPCGLLETRTRLFPGGHPRFGHYKVQFDSSRRYRTRALPRIVTAISIRAL